MQPSSREKRRCNKAAKYLKAIALRGNPDYTMPAKGYLDDVLEERRKELISEGHPHVLTPGRNNTSNSY